MSARAIPPRFVPKVWGSTTLEPWFPNTTEKIGEVWFPAGALLIKFLFTTENLSIQVHPGDEYAAANEDSHGKTEMWHILRAQDDAKIASGFRVPLDKDTLRASMRDGSIVDRMAWIPVRPGETYFTPAGTVHAIGAGLALCEIQQNSDVTYRMFDYGRPRDLHIDRAVDVADCGCHQGFCLPQPLGDGRELLVDCDYFVTERWHLTAPAPLPANRNIVALEGSARIDGQEMHAGTVWQSDSESLLEPSPAATLLVTWLRTNEI